MHRRQCRPGITHVRPPAVALQEEVAPRLHQHTLLLIAGDKARQGPTRNRAQHRSV